MALDPFGTREIFMFLEFFLENELIRQRTHSAMVDPPVAEATRLGSIPSLGISRVWHRCFPLRELSSVWVVCVYVCSVDAFRDLLGSLTLSPVFERAVGIGVQYESYMIC
jgi:hypothetical protein